MPWCFEQAKPLLTVELESRSGSAGYRRPGYAMRSANSIPNTGRILSMARTGRETRSELAGGTPALPGTRRQLQRTGELLGVARNGGFLQMRGTGEGIVGQSCGKIGEDDIGLQPLAPFPKQVGAELWVARTGEPFGHRRDADEEFDARRHSGAEAFTGAF